MKIKHTAKRTSMLKPALLAVGLLLAASSIQVAYATYHDKHVNLYDNCTLIGSNTISKTITGTFESASPHLTFLTDWFEIDHAPGWTCTTYRNEAEKGLKVGIKTWISNSYWAPNFEHDGDIYTIYKAGADAHHVGYLMRQNPSITQSVEQPHDTWRALNTSNTNNDARHMFLLINAHQTSYTVSIQTQVRLIKWDPDQTQFSKVNFTIPDFETARFSYWTDRLGTGKEHHWPAAENVDKRPSRFSRISASLKRMDNTCSTPSSQTVELPKAYRSDFNGIDSAVGNRSFTLDLTNCSTNISSIQYKLKSPDNNTVDDNQNGRLALDPKSSAIGVKVQVRDPGGNAIKFSDTIRYAIHNHEKGAPAASIPLQARYIQTDPTVGAGTVYTHMTVTYIYQ